MKLQTSRHGSRDTNDGAGKVPLPRGLRIVLGLIIVGGLALRVVYPGATVFTEDQTHGCALAEDIAHGYWQTGGLINSGTFRNLPGFVYVMAAVWWVWSDPLALLYFVGFVNIGAVLLAAYLMRGWIGPAAAWWGTAFFCAAPWAIHFSRWIWAQHLMFPVALVVYLFLWRWVCKGKRWSALGVVLSLSVLVQIHLVGVVLVLALGLFMVWCRPKLPVGPLVVGVVIGVVSVLPYLLAGHLGFPKGNRLGYQHCWRVIPGAAMSVTGLGRQIEYRAGYGAFVESLGWRHGPYQVLMGVPVVVLVAGVAMGWRRLWRERSEGLARRREPWAMAAALAMLIPLSFDLMGLRTSPTYLPIWYPLPFMLMGLAVVQLMQRWEGRWQRICLVAILLLALFGQLLFFVEELRYVNAHGGVPGAAIGRSYGGMKSDVADLAGRVEAAEVWMLYEGPSIIQDEPAAYLLRHAQWAGLKAGRALVHFRWWQESYGDAGVVEILPEGSDPPAEAYLIRPWSGPQQRGSEIPLRP